MIIHSPDDTIQNFLILICRRCIERKISPGKAGQLADEGEAPALKKYHYVPLDTINELQMPTLHECKSFCA